MPISRSNLPSPAYHRAAKGIRSVRAVKGFRGFTLIEVLVASVITTFVLGAVSVSVAQITRAKNASRERLEACTRADAALSAIRRDVATVSRADDLFYTRFMLTDDRVNGPAGTFDRDELLLFNTRLGSTRHEAYVGEGMEYETQYRIVDDDLGPVLWQRRDAMPDEYDRGGGIATPTVEGVISLNIEAYDGFRWYDVWDSDEIGLPLAVRITVTASGHHDGQNFAEAAWVTLRTVVAIDRVAPPADLFQDEPLPSADGTAAGTDSSTGGKPNISTTGDPTAAPAPGAGMPRLPRDQQRAPRAGPPPGSGGNDEASSSQGPNRKPGHQ